MSYICTQAETPSPVVRVLAELAYCCMGAAEDGPSGCTCWEPVYDLEQQPTGDDPQPGQRTEMCGDCAYRPDSPERQGDDRHTCSDEGELDDIARGDNPFWCHVGLRKPTGYRHATLGIVVPADTDAYDPPMVTIDGQRVPVKADGTAGDRCAGWAARKKQLAAEAAVSTAEQIAMWKHRVDSVREADERDLFVTPAQYHDLKVLAADLEDERVELAARAWRASGMEPSVDVRSVLPIDVALLFGMQVVVDATAAAQQAARLGLR